MINLTLKLKTYCASTDVENEAMMHSPHIEENAISKIERFPRWNQSMMHVFRLLKLIECYGLSSTYYCHETRTK